MSGVHVHRSLVIVPLAILVGFVSSCSTSPDFGKPNIVFIMADDLGYAHLGAYGQEKIRTPNIDRLADEGIRYTQF